MLRALFEMLPVFLMRLSIGASVLVVAGLGAQSASDRPAVAESTVAAAIRSYGRDTLRFDHKRHKEYKCEACHVASRQIRRLTLSAPDDCRSCHHAADARAGKCAACHSSEVLPRGIAVSVTLAVSARKTAAITRTLEFPHHMHRKFECKDCHSAGPTQPVEVTCNSCHADHHEPQRECAACHASAKIGHNRAIHDGCTSCHTNRRVRTLTASRALCVMCHAPQRTHFAGLECAPCHAVTLASKR